MGCDYMVEDNADTTLDEATGLRHRWRIPGLFDQLWESRGDLSCYAPGSAPHRRAAQRLMDIYNQIKQAVTVKALLCTHRSHASSLNDIHLSACWASLGQLARLRACERRWVQGSAQVMELLVHHTVLRVEAGKVEARQIVNVAYGAACSYTGESLSMLFTTLARAAEWRMGDFNAQNLANTAWAFAKTKQVDGHLFTALPGRV